MTTVPPRGALTIDRPPSATRRLSYAALLVATALTGVYAETIPNFEVMTLVIFGAGVLLGARDGAMVGILTMLVYSVLNPYGPAHPVITGSQMAGEALAGIAGAAFARAGLPARSPRVRAGVLAIAAVLITAVYDLVTNLATGVVFGQPRAWLIQGIGYSLWHIGTNVLLFTTLGTPLVGVFAHYRERLSS